MEVVPWTILNGWEAVDGHQCTRPVTWRHVPTENGPARRGEGFLTLGRIVRVESSRRGESHYNGAPHCGSAKTGPPSRITHSDSDATTGANMRCNDETTPVIFEIARSRDFDNDLQQFDTEIINQSVEMSDGVLRYRGLRGSGEVVRSDPIHRVQAARVLTMLQINSWKRPHECGHYEPLN